MAFYLAYLLAFYLANLLAYLLTSYLAFYLANLLAFYLANIQALYLAYLLAFYLAYLLGFYLAYLLAFYLAYLLAFYLAYLMAYYVAYHSIWHIFWHIFWPGMPKQGNHIDFITFDRKHVSKKAQPALATRGRQWQDLEHGSKWMTEDSNTYCRQKEQDPGRNGQCAFPKDLTRWASGLLFRLLLCNGLGFKVRFDQRWTWGRRSVLV